MEYRSILFFFLGLGGFQVVFGVENGLSIVHFLLGQLELSVI